MSKKGSAHGHLEQKGCCMDPFEKHQKSTLGSMTTKKLLFLCTLIDIRHRKKLRH